MKTYYIYISIAILATFLIIAIPQLTGRIYVSDLKERTPTDLLSKLFMENEHALQSGLHTYNLPSHIRTIKVIGQSENKRYNYRIHLFNASDKNEPQINYEKDDKIAFQTKGDTLIIRVGKEQVGPSLTCYINDEIQNSLIFEQINEGYLYFNELKNLTLTVDNKSVIHWIGRNSTTKKITLRNQSNMVLFNANQPVMDMQIENSMVNVTPINQLDSLRAELMGKSNIKTVHNDTYYFEKKEMDSLLKKAHIRIFPTGDLTYVQAYN